MNSYLKHLKEDPLVYYVYRSDLSIYNIPTENLEYIVIINENYQVPEEYKEYSILNLDSKLYRVNFEESIFTFYNIQDWFQKVLNCEIIAWECSCLNKKFVHKEHVKLILTVNNSKIRKNFKENSSLLFASALLNIKENQLKFAKESLFQILKEADFSNQIIDNHKIINFKTPKIFYDKLFSCDSGESLMITFLELYNNVGTSLYDNNWEDLLT